MVMEYAYGRANIALPFLPIPETFIFLKKKELIRLCSVDIGVDFGVLNSLLWHNNPHFMVHIRNEAKIMKC